MLETGVIDSLGRVRANCDVDDPRRRHHQRHGRRCRSARIFRTGSASVTIHHSQPRDVSGTDYADYRLYQLELRAEMRAEVAVWRPAGFRRVSEAS